jgi:pimeloyl-ACP methyl ester carboxylesterase
MTPPEYFHGRDGVRLAYREIGEGRPVVLIHGYFSTAEATWLRTGHAAEIAARGHRVIMPDTRGHGDSARPHDPAAYPRDVLTDDGFALVEHLGLSDYDLGGYSIGGRTTMRMLARGATPRRAVVAGQGLRSVTKVPAPGRRGHFAEVLAGLGAFEPGTPEWRTERVLRELDGDPVALRHVTAAFAETPREAFARITMPVLVVRGADDDAADAERLALALPDGRYATVPGDHETAVSTPANLGAAIADFLAAA